MNRHHIALASALTLTILGLSACETQDQKKPMANPPTETGAPTEPSPPSEPTPTSAPTADLVVVSGTNGDWGLTPIKLGEDGAPSVLGTLSVDAGEYDVVGAHDGTHACVASSPKDAQGKSTRVMRYALGSPSAAPAGAEIEPNVFHSMFVDGTTCVVGGNAATILRVDFAGDAPAVTDLNPKTEEVGYWSRKAIDFFLDTGSHLLAVDDIMAPFFVFVFEWEGEGQARTLPVKPKRVELPSGVNASYKEGIVVGGQAIMHRTYSRRGGWGQILEVYDVADLTGATPGTEPYDADVAPKVTTAEWHSRIQRDPGEPTFGVLAGDAYTNWKGLASVDSRLFVGAGERGILSTGLPIQVAKRERGETDPNVSAHDLGGAAILDVVRVEGALFALAATSDKTELVRLAWNEKSQDLEVVARVDVPSSATRFLTKF